MHAISKKPSFKNGTPVNLPKCGPFMTSRAQRACMHGSPWYLSIPRITKPTIHNVGKFFFIISLLVEISRYIFHNSLKNFGFSATQPPTHRRSNVS